MMFFSFSLLLSFLFLTNNFASSKITYDAESGNHGARTKRHPGHDHLDVQQQHQPLEGITDIKTDHKYKRMTLPDAECFPSPCENECICEQSCKRQGGYYCISPLGYLGKNCSYAPPTISCKSDEIEIDIVRTFLDQTLYTSRRFYLSKAIGNDKCNLDRKTRSGSYHFEIDVNRNSICMDKVGQVNDYVEYTSTLWSDLTGTLSNRIEMPIPIVKFSCKYRTDYYVSTAVQPILSQPVIIEQNGAALQMKMVLCKQSMCSGICPAHLQVGSQGIYTVGERIYVGVVPVNPIVSSSVLSGMVMSLPKVTLSCSRVYSPMLEIGINLFDNGCINSDDGLAGLQTRPGALQINRACFSFLTARLQGCKDQFYIHAHVDVCETPVKKCSGGQMTCHNRRRRRSTESAEDNEILSIGPLYIGYKETTAEGSFLPMTETADDNENATFVHQKAFRIRSDEEELPVIEKLPSVVNPVYKVEYLEKEEVAAPSHPEVDPLVLRQPELNESVVNWHVILIVGIFLVLFSVLLLYFLFFQFYSRYFVGAAQSKGLQ